MSEMVERVARAIFEQGLGHGNIPWDSRPRAFHDQMRLEARAAIGAMREPSTGIVISIAASLVCWEESTPADVWNDIIDAALK